MSSITETVDVHVPVSTAYNQWTQFESFPQFMGGVEAVRQTSDTHTHWTIKVAGVTREFDAEVTEQTPDQRISWRSVSGTGHAGVVTFHKLTDEDTRVALQLDTEPDGAVEKAGDAVGLTTHAAKADLDRFKAFIEGRGTATGAWRGDVPRD